MYLGGRRHGCPVACLGWACWSTWLVDLTPVGAGGQQALPAALAPPLPPRGSGQQARRTSRPTQGRQQDIHAFFRPGTLQPDPNNTNLKITKRLTNNISGTTPIGPVGGAAGRQQVQQQAAAGGERTAAAAAPRVARRAGRRSSPRTPTANTPAPNPRTVAPAEKRTRETDRTETRRNCTGNALASIGQSFSWSKSKERPRKS